MEGECENGDVEYDVGDEYDLVVVHVDKAIRLFCQLVALCDVAIPGCEMSTTWMIWIW